MASEIRVNQIQNRSGLTTTTFTDTGVTISGILTVSENLNVGGVVTYEDVTNVDSVGVITARDGLRVTGIATATAFHGDGSALTGINADLVNDTSPQLGGNLDTNSHNIFLDDDHKVIFGNDQSADLHIFHESSSGTGNIYNATGEFRVRSNDIRLKNLGNSETYLKATNNGAIELYHDNAVKLTTESDGIKIHAAEGGEAIISLFADEGDDPADKYRIVAQNSGDLVFQRHNGSGFSSELRLKSAGGIQANYQGSNRFETTSAGITVGGSIDVNDNCKLLIGDSDDLQIDHSGTNSQIYHNGTGHLYIAALGSSENIILQSTSGDLKFSAGGSERLKIDSNGYVTKANHPSFCARYQSGDGYVSTNIFRLTGINNDNFTWNTGSHYSTSTGKFTCPVAGVYFFEGQAMTTGHSNNDNIQDMMELRTNNGLVTYCRQRRTYFKSDVDANGYYVNGTSGQVNLAVGDTVWFQRRSGLGYSYGNSHYTYFTGWLIG